MNRHRWLPAVEGAMIVAVLFAIYVGSYFAIVMPQGYFAGSDDPLATIDECYVLYRICPKHTKILFWPLEQLDRRIRWWD